MNWNEIGMIVISLLIGGWVGVLTKQRIAYYRGFNSGFHTALEGVSKVMLEWIEEEKENEADKLGDS